MKERYVSSGLSECEFCECILCCDVFSWRLSLPRSESKQFGHRTSIKVEMNRGLTEGEFECGMDKGCFCRRKRRAAVLRVEV